MVPSCPRGPVKDAVVDSSASANHGLFGKTIRACLFSFEVLRPTLKFECSDMHVTKCVGPDLITLICTQQQQLCHLHEMFGMISVDGFGAPEQQFDWPTQLKLEEEAQQQ